MNIFDFIFILSFLIISGINGYKIYNVLHKFSIYDIKMSFMLFVGTLFFWLCNFIIFLLGRTDMYRIFFSITNFMLTLSMMLFLIEIIVLIKSAADNKVIKAYISNRTPQ